MTKGIILLSGGLDSLVSIAMSAKSMDIKLALTFDYGQKSAPQEINAAKEIAYFYNIEHEIIQLPWLMDITNTALVKGETPKIETDELDNSALTEESAKSVWVPNRNGLFINIAACYADSLKYDKIIIGANKEEAATFPDNSKEFISNINKSLKKSAMYDVEVIAPLIDMNKDEIVKAGLDENAPMLMVHSCYGTGEIHCGICESCSRFKRALLNTGQYELIAKIFE